MQTEKCKTTKCSVTYLFCIVILALIQHIESECQFGYPIGGLLSNLSYADDIAVLSDSRSELQRFLDLLAKYAAKVGLVNVLITKCMTTNKVKSTLHLTIYSEKPIQQVSEYIYLGHKLSSKNDSMAGLQYRIGLGCAALSKIKSALTSNESHTTLSQNSLTLT